MKTLRCVGLDVHKDSIAIAVAESEGGEPSLVGTIPNDTRLLLQKLKKLGGGKKVRCCYEAGPTGYGLHRDLNAAGVPCIVVAPSLVPKQVGSRVKTDRRDAVKLARFLRSGDLTEVAVPDQATEAMRDLERARPHHPDGKPPRQTSARRSGVGLPIPRFIEQGDSRTQQMGTAPDSRDRMESPIAASPPLRPHERPRHVQAEDRDGDRSRTRRVHLGYRPGAAETRILKKTAEQRSQRTKRTRRKGNPRPNHEHGCRRVPHRRPQ